MPVSFKQFSTFLSSTSDATTPEELNEVFGRLFGKEPDVEDKRAKVLTAKDLLAKKKEKEEERKRELQRKRDEAFLQAKERIEGGKSGPTRLGRSDRDEYALHRQIKEERNSFTSQAEWKDAASAEGYTVKKLSGNAEDGDQTWCAYDKTDAKVGEYSESDEGGWLA